MEIHRYERVWTVAAGVLIVAFIATVAYGAVGAGVKMVDDSGGTVDVDAITDSPNFEEPGVYDRGNGQYDVYVIARQFFWEPGTNEPIQVPAGSTVTFYVTSADVVHGFELAGTNVNAMVIPGQVTKLTVRFDEARTYGIVCNEYCGALHHDMEGRVVVTEPGQADMEPDEDAAGGADP